jgi:Putative transposase/Transposase zinc-binding domain
LSLGSLLRRYGDAFVRRYPETPLGVQQVLARLAACRTPALGGQVTACCHCGAVRYLYHSCGDRHCPACGGSKRAAWLERRRAELLPVPYFHVVFTLPHQLSAVVLGNRRLLYPLLMRSAAQTLLEVAADPQHLGARLGALLVLHTWGQQLEHHPHVHAVVPGGGLSADGSQWRSCRSNFLLPVKVLGRVFRGKYLEALRQAQVRGELRLAGSTAALLDPAVFDTWLGTLYRTPWVVYAKEPFGKDAEQVLKYLAGYTHRVAFSNARLVRLADDQVTFTYKDYADGCRPKELRLAAVEFIRRFALHVVPGRLVRLRQYGLLSHRGRQRRLAECRQLLGGCATLAVEPAQPEPALPEPAPPRPTCAGSWLALLLPLLFVGLPPLPTLDATPAQAPRCLNCGVGRLQTLWQAPRAPSRALPPLSVWPRRACPQEIPDSS